MPSFVIKTVWKKYDENDKIDEALSLEFVGGELNEILDEFMLLALSPNCDLFIPQNWSFLY